MTGQSSARFETKSPGVMRKVCIFTMVVVEVTQKLLELWHHKGDHVNEAAN